MSLPPNWLAGKYLWSIYDVLSALVINIRSLENHLDLIVHEQAYTTGFMQGKLRN